MRASDREREATLRVLNEGCAEGRLSTSTFEERVERALTAKSDSELRQLTVDISPVSRLRALLARRSEHATAAATVRLSDVDGRPLLIGRSRQADLTLGDDTVSRRHALLARTDDGFVLTDLSSTNGTWMGGRRVGQVEVVPGDVVLLGERPLRFL